ncbi:MAG: hypothetical protein JKY50_10755 [Oleispira sp.]|nr:hypothetical protein [Oleispira sp.]MBL4880884.1 hypothetical protein [Oleispira sp.]
MKNGILVSLLVLWLAACGGESETSKSTLSIGTELSAGIKGMEMEPALIDADISEGDIASLNTNYTGNVLEGSSIRFSFTLAEDKQVALFLSVESEDLDLAVEGHNIDLMGSYYDSYKLIIFDAVAGENYAVNISSIGDEGEFQLKFSEASRSSVGLANNEYLVSLEVNDKEKCIYGRLEEEYTHNSSRFVLINWSAGYIDNLYGLGRWLFSSVNGNAFTINDSNSISWDLGSSSWQDTLTLSTDFLTGAITGSASGSSEYSEVYETGGCNYSGVRTGSIIL